MARLSLYVDARGRSALHRDGFTWLGGLVPPIWALTRRLWMTALAAAVLGTALNKLVTDAIGKVGDPNLELGLTVAWLVLWVGTCGFVANRWHRLCLHRAGYRLIATESAGAGDPSPRAAQTG